MSKRYPDWLPRLFAAMFVAAMLMAAAAGVFGIVYLILTYLKFWGIGLVIFAVATTFIYLEMSS